MSRFGASARAAPTALIIGVQPPNAVVLIAPTLDFEPTGTGSSREANVRARAPPARFGARGLGATPCVTPRQTCPRPNGFGRNLRSKTRWFTGFCNSHQVSQFATFFIDARAEISVAESRVWIKISSLRGERKAGQPLRRARQYKCSLTPKAPWVLLWPLRRSSGALAGPRPDGTRNAFAVCFV